MKFQLTAARRRLVTDLHAHFLTPYSFNSQPPEGGWHFHNRFKRASDCFNSQPPEGGWRQQAVTLPRMTGFQLTAARRRLAEAKSRQGSNSNCFNSQPPEGGWKTGEILETDLIVSTHSRPKAAGSRRWRSQAAVCCFNSQPPEGGWFHVRPPHPRQTGFNSQPPEGGWARAFR